MIKQTVIFEAIAMLAIISVSVLATGIAIAQNTGPLPSGVIAGRVLSNGSAPVENAVVTLYLNGSKYDSSFNPQASKNGTTNDGVFVFPHLEAGTYKIIVTSGTAQGMMDNITVSNGTMSVSIVLPGVSGNNTTTQFTPPISGLVLDKNGASVPDAQVTLYNANGPVDITRNPQMSDNGSSTGMYEFGFVPDGNYTVTASINDSTGVNHQGNAMVTIDGPVQQGMGLPYFVVLSDYVLEAASNTTVTPTTLPMNNSTGNATVTVLPANTTDNGTTTAQPTLPPNMTTTEIKDLAQSTPGMTGIMALMAFIAIAIVALSVRRKDEK